MTLIKSISGIRGIIGGTLEEGLNPVSIAKFTAAYAAFIRRRARSAGNRIVVGRDARISGEMVKSIVTGTLTGMGFDAVDIGLATTPTTELAVVGEQAAGGLILTASHNPAQWNALKLLNAQGEFLHADEGNEVLRLAETGEFTFVGAEALGRVTTADYADYHINKVLQLEAVDVDAIRAAGFRVAIDCVNSVGGLILPDLLHALGVREVFQVHSEPNGLFAHNPEPLPEHLTDLADLVVQRGADVGFAVDPDVDRLAIVCEDGRMFGEEYTLVAVSDYVLGRTPGATVSNLSSSRALRDVAQRHGCPCYSAAVGEVNVVEKMKTVGAVIGGEGNGGVIYPACHCGRDALVGIALFLTHLAGQKSAVSRLRASYPSYFMSKRKMELAPDTDIHALLSQVKAHFDGYEVTDMDGVKVDFPDRWVHLRRSNTEPVVRIYAEAPSQAGANLLAGELVGLMDTFVRPKNGIAVHA
ncbi:MAG: phosphoglucosamine mutase [Tannerella sp.]|jgi:phosphomannomutase|nr:phosphoglucosamine mutase [Tannerella sp.]